MRVLGTKIARVEEKLVSCFEMRSERSICENGMDEWMYDGGEGRGRNRRIYVWVLVEMDTLTTSIFGSGGSNLILSW